MKIFYYLFFTFFGFISLGASTLYNPNETDFYNNLINKTHDWIVYNTNGTYNYSQTRNINVTGNNILNIMFDRSTSTENVFIIENLVLAGYDKINIYIRHRVAITLKNCTFNFKKNGGLKFYFENDNYLYPLSENDTKVTIDGCTLNNDCINSSDTGIMQLYFTKDRYPVPDDTTKNYRLKNIEIKNSNFNSINYPNSLHNKLTAIRFFRRGSEVYYSDINILGTKIEFTNINNAMTEGITFNNLASSNFRSPSANFYTLNKNINIQNNYLYTDSNDPAHAVFIQGPYAGVNIINNEMYNFGANFPQEKDSVVHLHLDGAVHLYGAREKSYCDDIINATVSDNIIHSVSTGIQLLGTKHSIINGNNILINDWPVFWHDDALTETSDRAGIKVSTGDPSSVDKQCVDIDLSNNTINCNGLDACEGLIVANLKDFTVGSNKIYYPDNFGILYFGHSSNVMLDIGTSYIDNNYITFGEKTINDLNSHFYNYSEMTFSGIHFYRMDNGGIYQNEELFIRNNQIVCDPSIPLVTKNDLNSHSTIAFHIEGNYSSPLSVSISGPTYLGSNVQGTFTANPSGGSGTYTNYRWWWRNDASGGIGPEFAGFDNGIDYVPPGNYWYELTAFEGKQTITIGKPDDFSLKCEVTDSDNNTAIDIHSIIVGRSFAKAQGANSYKIELVSVPEQVELTGNYPNPFNPSTTIRFGLPEDSNVKITIYSINGQEVITLANGYFSKGYHEIKWNGKNPSGRLVANGLYITELKTGNKRLIKKMVFAK